MMCILVLSLLSYSIQFQLNGFLSRERYALRKGKQQMLKSDQSQTYLRIPARRPMQHI